MHPFRRAACCFALALAGCASSPHDLDSAGGVVPALLLGEQHDAPEHQQLHRQVIEALADRDLLAAVVLEMAERGRSTRGLPQGASEQQVREALGWGKEGWPWTPYAPAVMAAVRAGVPVLGANLGAQQMRAAMADTHLDNLVPAVALRAQQEAIRVGHCGEIAEGQVGPMARIQIARDRAMAETVSAAAQRDKTVVLLAGAGHVDPKLGVPLHLPARLQAQTQPVMLAPVDTGKDYCGDLRQQMQMHRAKPAP